MAKPVLDLTLVKQHLRVEHDLDDVLIAHFAAAAVDHVLNVIGLAGELEGNREHEARTTRFRIRCIPVQSVKKVERRDGDTWALVPESEWNLSGNHDLGYVLDIAGPVALHRITLEYGFEGGTMPPALKLAALFLVSHYYENRGAVAVGSGVAAVELPLGVKSLLDPWRNLFFA